MDGENWYVYANNNPIMFIDPWGLAALKTLGTGVFGGIDGKYYGGNQSWFSKKGYQNTGCGTVSAANIFAYFAQQRSDLSTLYNHADKSKENFTNHMNDVVKKVNPTLFGVSVGIWDTYEFSSKVKSYAKSQGVELEAKIKNHGDFQSIVDFVNEGLEKDSPVAFLMYDSAKNEFNDYTLHWMTITRLDYNENDKNYYATFSTWGEPIKLNFNDLVIGNGPNISFVYFTKGD